MSDAVYALIGTIISGLVSAILCNKLIQYRIEQLEKKVDKHNNLIERTYNLEKDIAVIQEDLKDLKNN